MPSSATRSRLLLLLATVVAVLTAGLCLQGIRKVSAGVEDLAVSQDVRQVIGPPIDLRLRWVEWRYIFEHGQNPFDVYLADEPEGPVAGGAAAIEERAPESLAVDNMLGPVLRAPYPPWAYPLATPIWSLPWPIARLAMAVVSVLSIGAISLHAWRTGRRGFRLSGLLAIAIVVGAAHHYTALRLGQPTQAVVAALALAAAALHRRWHVAAGVLVALAMLKPTIAAPFVVVLMVSGAWRSVASCGITLIVSSCIPWLLTGVTPWHMVSQMRLIAEAIEVGKEGAAGPIAWFIDVGLTPAMAARVTALLVVGFFTALLWRFRKRHVSVLFAIAALGSVLWTHQKPYDELVMLLIAGPILGLLGRMLVRWRDGERDLPWAALLVTLTYVLSMAHLGLPHAIGGSGGDAWVAAQIGCWTLCVSLLLLERRLLRLREPVPSTLLPR